MPIFRAFRGLRYAAGADLDAVLAPPYDVLSPEDIAQLQQRAPRNIAWIDDPGDDYAAAGQRLIDWQGDGTLVRDADRSLSIYRFSFTDAAGRDRQIAGLIGGLAVVDDGAGGVLPHEQTTPKATTDRLDLTRATKANLSPIWGLSLASGLTEALRQPGEVMGSVVVDGVTHTVERVSDPDRVAALEQLVGGADVLIADGHHRYSIARTYRDEVRAESKHVCSPEGEEAVDEQSEEHRDEVRALSGRTDTPAELTLALINELVDDQLSIEAIHRLYGGLSADDLVAALEPWFELETATPIGPTSLADMVEFGRLTLLWPDGRATWLTPRPGVFSGLRALDGLYLETALAHRGAEVSYQHGLAEMQAAVASGKYTAGILIRPTSIAEIRYTADEGQLMPPKSTFFTPKPLTGWVLRLLDQDIF